jgi:hypothetical protein
MIQVWIQSITKKICSKSGIEIDNNKVRMNYGLFSNVVISNYEKANS